MLSYIVAKLLVHVTSIKITVTGRVRDSECYRMLVLDLLNTRAQIDCSERDMCAYKKCSGGISTREFRPRVCFD